MQNYSNCMTTCFPRLSHWNIFHAVLSTHFQNCISSDAGINVWRTNLLGMFLFSHVIFIFCIYYLEIMTRCFSAPVQAYINKMKLVSPSVKQREKILSFHLQNICASIAEPIVCSSAFAQGHEFIDCKVISSK